MVELVNSEKLGNVMDSLNDVLNEYELSHIERVAVIANMANYDTIVAIRILEEEEK